MDTDHTDADRSARSPVEPHELTLASEFRFHYRGYTSPVRYTAAGRQLGSQYGCRRDVAVETPTPTRATR